MPGTTFSADNVIGHTLYALRDIPVFMEPYDNSVPYRTVPAGGYVGQVINYLQPSSYRKDFYWVISTAAGQNYVRHHEGDFDIDALEAQGVQTIEDQIAQQQLETIKDSSPVEYYLRKYGLWVLGGILGIVVVKELVKKHL